MARTQESRRAHTRAALLKSAADLFARQGFHATSADAIAAAADRTTGALYDHFGGKSGLLVALLEEWVRLAIDQLGDGPGAAAGLDGRLGALWGGVASDAGDASDVWLLLEVELWLHAVRDPELASVAASRFAQMRDGLAGALRSWSEELAVPLPAPASELAVQLIGLLLGLGFQHRLDPAAVPHDQVIAGLRRLLQLEPGS
ncbi:MAG: TetR/AcrR family transcriptional regulator [Microthrixaceae bacterium]